jgi:hypothetical protein
MGAATPTSYVACLYVAKLDTTKSGAASLVYSNVISSGAGEVVAVDAYSNVYLTGAAGSDLPVSAGAYQSTTSYQAAFVMKLDPTATHVLYSSLLGSDATGYLVSVDSSGSVYISGVTQSSSFPLSAGAFQTYPAYPGQSPFLAKFDPSQSGATSLIYSTFFPGQVAGLFPDSDGNVTIGGAAGPGVPTTSSAIQTYSSNASPLLAKLNSQGTGLVYATYFGQNASVGAFSVDSGGAVYFAGNGTVPLTAGAIPQGDGLFVSKINPAAGTCVTSATTSSQSIGVSVGSIAVNVNAPSSCTWSASSNSSWITTNSSGTGSGTATFSVAAADASARTAIIDVSGNGLTINQPGAGCSYSVGLGIGPQSQNNLSFQAATYYGFVTTQTGCSWTTSSSANWITLVGGASFSASLTMQVASNPGPSSRTGTITVAGQTFTLTQAAAVSQTITFATLPSNVTATALPTPSATASSGLPVQFTVPIQSASVCFVNSGFLLFFTAGTCTITANQFGNYIYSSAPPVTQSLTVQVVPNAQLSPSSGAGVSQVFTAVFGQMTNSILNDVALQVGPTGSSCSIRADLYGISLWNDANTALLGPLTPTTTLTNSRCTLNGGGSSMTTTGSTTTLVVSLSFKPTLAGTQNVYLYEDDFSNNNSGSLLRGTYTVASAVPNTSKVGVFQSGTWALDANGNGIWDGPPGDEYFRFTPAPGDVAVVGDWNGDGHAKAGLYRNGFWILDYNGNGVYDGPTVDRFIALGGNPGEVPVVGDWNGDGRTKVGVNYRGFWTLDYNGNGQWDGVAGGDRFIAFGGNPGEVPVVGDWNGDGRTKVGYFFNGIWALDYNGNGQWDGPLIDRYYNFGGAGDIPVVGDWSGTHSSKIGVNHSGFWLLDYNGNGQWDGTTSDRFIALGGNPGETPVTGDWNGDGKTKVGYYFRGFWVLDFNGNGQWDGVAGGDRFIALGGQTGEQPLVGKW